MDTPEKRRWYRPMPSWLVFGSLAVTGLLFLSERWRWFPFNEHKGWTVLVAVAGVGVVLLLMLAWFLVALVFRWRFQFGIRTLLILVVAVALPCSWLAVEMKNAREQNAAVEALREVHSGAYYDGGYPDGLALLPGGMVCQQVPGASEPLWLRRMFGDDFFANVVGVWIMDDSLSLPASRRPDVTDAQLSPVEELRQLEWLKIQSNQVTDAGLKHVRGLTRLQLLELWNTRITDAGMEYLGGLANLQCLQIQNADITDLGPVAGLPQLRSLFLCNTHLTDRGLERLSRLTQLENIYLNGCNVTLEGDDKFRKAMPQCIITR